MRSDEMTSVVRQNILESTKGFQSIEPNILDKKALLGFLIRDRGEPVIFIIFSSLLSSSTQHSLSSPGRLGPRTPSKANTTTRH